MYNCSNKYPKAQAITKMNPGPRFGMAVAVAGEVRFIPFSCNVWNNVTLQTKRHQTQKREKGKKKKQLVPLAVLHVVNPKFYTFTSVSTLSC